MTIGKFFKDVFCAPYSLPIGIINYKVATIGFCSKTKSESIELSEIDNHSSLYKDKAEIEQQDIISSSQLAILNQGIQDILSETYNLNTQTISSSVSATVKSFTIDDDGEVTTILSQSEDPNNEYLQFIRNYKTEKLGDDGNIYLIKEFGCTPPTIDQVQEINVYSISELNYTSFERIISEVSASIENTFAETDSDIPSSTYTSVLTDNRIKNMIKQKIDSMITNISSQTINTELELEYIDRYGKCIYDYTEKGLLKTNTDKHTCNLQRDLDIPDYIHGVCTGTPNKLKQSVNIEVISKNIIDITIGLVLETTNNVDTESKVKINRVTNHRAIVVSLLFNVIFIYLLFKLFSLFLKSIN